MSASTPDLARRHRNRSGRGARLSIALATVWCGPGIDAAWAQEAGGGSGLRLTPLFSAEQTFVEYRVRPTRENGVESVTRVSPGLRISSRSGRLQGSLTYNANVLYRAGLEESKGREVQNALDAEFRAELVSNFAFIDARASISEQAISALGQPVGTALQTNRNRTEVASASLSPYLRGTLGSLVQYELRVAATDTNSRSESAPNADSRQTTSSFSLGSGRGGGRLGWGLVGSRQRTDYRLEARPAETDRVNASLSYVADVDLRFTVTGGQESTNVGLIDKKRYDNWGAGLQWTPSPRTTVSLQGEDRYFGRSHRASLQYRTPRTAWVYTDSRDVTNGADATGVGQPQTLYALLYQQYASIEPDPAKRDTLVLDFLRQVGRDPNERLVGGALTTGVSVQRRQDLAATWQGPRLSLTVQAFKLRTTQIDAGGPVVSGGQDYAQTGYASGLSYRLTPETSVTLGGARTMTDATTGQIGTDLKSAYATLTSTLGRRASASLQGRYSVFNSPTDPYRETLVSGSISLRF